MVQVTSYSGRKEENYRLLLKELKSLIEGETDEVTLLANASALLNQFLDEVNWIGFYMWKENELILGPFQGLPACTRIPYGQGVCGTSIKERKTLRVADVRQFPGHITCDAASKSEIVIPMMVGGNIYGVLDIDSPMTDRFDEIDQEYLEECVTIIEHFLA